MEQLNHSIYQTIYGASFMNEGMVSMVIQEST